MATAVGIPIPSYDELCYKSKPYLAMNYPLHSYPNHAPRVRSKRGQPFDPEDLSRRLKAHLAEQKALTECRRAARVSVATGVYHHVPQVAAVSFESTTAPDKLRQVRKLSEPALKSLGVLTTDEELTGFGKPTTSFQRSQTVDYATTERSRLRNRNQYQWTAALERAAELDAERDVYRCPRRTFDSDVPVVHKSRAVQRPMSMGDFNSWEKEEKRNKNDRHDWTQRDESSDVRRSVKDRMGPLLSLKLGKGKGDDKMVEGINPIGEGDKLRSPVRSPIRASFFGKFKRNSS